MAEHLLHHPDICPVGQQVRRTGVAQDVRTDDVAQPYHCSSALEEREGCLAGESTATCGQEERRLISTALPTCRSQGPSTLGASPAVERSSCVGTERHDALSVALPANQEEAVTAVDAHEVEGSDLTHPSPRCIEHLEDGTVSSRQWIIPIAGVQNQGDLVHREGFRQRRSG